MSALLTLSHHRSQLLSERSKYKTSIRRLLRDQISLYDIFIISKEQALSLLTARNLVTQESRPDLPATSNLHLFPAKLSTMVIPPPGLGLGDIYNILLEIYHFVQRCRNADQTIIAVGRDCHSLEQGLEDLEWKVNNPNFDDVHGLKAKKWIPIIKETFPALDKKLKRMRSIIREFPEEGHPMFPIKKAFFTAHKLPELQEIQRNLAGFQAIYSRAYNSWGEEAHTQLYQDIQEMLERQDKSAQVQLQFQRDMQKILEFLEKKGVQEAQKVAKNDDSGRLMEWESELVREGVGEKEVRTILKPVIENLKINDTWSMEQHNNVTGRVSPKIEVEVKPIIVFGGGFGSIIPQEYNQFQASGLSQNWMQPRPSAPNISPSHSNSSGSKSPRAGTRDDDKAIWVLCVDEANGVQSILAQTYLELIRAWTANTTSRWLFDRVDSAGTNISTMFTKQFFPDLPICSPTRWTRGLEETNKAIDELAGDSSYFWSENYPHEKAVILKRMKQHRGRGIEARHFSTYHYMICFNTGVQETLRQLKRNWEIDHQKYSCTRILYLPDCIPQTDTWKNAEKPHISEVRELIRGFLKTEFGWLVPMEVGKDGKEKRMGIAGGKERTLMMVLPERYRVHIKGKEKDLSDRTGVRVRLTLEGTEEKHQLVSLTGERGKLAAAEVLIKGLA